MNKHAITRVEISGLLHEHVRLRPKMNCQDAYKLLHQTIFGPGHMGLDEAQVRRYLLNEVKHLNWKVRMKNEKTVESISPDGQVARVNLRKLLRPPGTRKQYIEKLIQVILESGKKTWGSHADFFAAWQKFISLVEDRELKFGTAALRVFNRIKVKNDYPPVSHSDVYTKAYQPAYRVVVKEVFDDHFNVTLSF